MDPWKRRSLRLESPSFVGSSRGPIDCHESHPTPPRGLHQTHEFQQTQGPQHFDTSIFDDFWRQNFCWKTGSFPILPGEFPEIQVVVLLFGDIAYFVDDLMWDVCVCVLIGGPY